MPELLSASVHNLIYQSRGLEVGKNVTACFCGPPGFVMGSAQPLTEIGGGVYRLAIDFTREGLYVVQFFEDGEATTTQTYRVYRVREILGELEEDRNRRASIRI